MGDRRKPGSVRDAIEDYLQSLDGGDDRVMGIQTAVEERLGEKVAPSSVRSYLRLSKNIARTDRGRYRWAGPR